MGGKHMSKKGYQPFSGYYTDPFVHPTTSNNPPSSKTRKILAIPERTMWITLETCLDPGSLGAVRKYENIIRNIGMECSTPIN